MTVQTARPAAQPLRPPAPLLCPHGYTRLVRGLFLAFALYLALPLVDVPLLGLSLSAPLFFVIALQVLLRSGKPWDAAHRRWGGLAIAIWLGVVVSVLANGLLSGGVNVDSDSLLYPLRYAYWLLVFFVTAVLVSRAGLFRPLCAALGWGALILALLRWAEVLLSGQIGAGVGTEWMSQNGYGFLFSVFSPFLLIAALQARGTRRLAPLAANLVVWGAVLINGSRGSWVAAAAGLAVFLLVLLLSRPRRFATMLVLLAAALAALVWALLAAQPLAEAVESRFATFDRLEEDKSYMVRTLMNQKALRLFGESPLVGVGAGRFRKSSIPLDIPDVLAYAPQAHFDVKSAHNAYLSFLAENGLAGGLPFAALLLGLAVGGLQAAVALSRRGAGWAAGVFAALVGMSVHMWGVSSLNSTVGWFIYGLVAAMIVTAQAVVLQANPLRHPPLPSSRQARTDG